MDNRFLFRGKCVHPPRNWVYGGYASLNGVPCIVLPETIFGDAAYIAIDPATIGQCAGHSASKSYRGDKPEDLLIWEGDICKCNDNPEDLVQICFGEFKVVDMTTEGFTDIAIGWYMKVIPTADPLSQCEPFCYDMQLNDYWIKQTGMEIIGTIHDGEGKHDNSNM